MKDLNLLKISFCIQGYLHQDSAADFCVYFGHHLVSCSAKKQPTVADYLHFSSVAPPIRWCDKYLCDFSSHNPVFSCLHKTDCGFLSCFFGASCKPLHVSWFQMRKTLKGEQDCKQQCGNLEMDQRSIGMTDCSSNGVVCQAFLKATKAQKCSNHHETKSDYESIRTARILENQARLASLGLHRTISDLRLASPVNTYVKKYQKVDYECTPRRCSARLKGTTADSITSDQYIPLQHSNRLRGTSSEPISPRKEKVKLFGKSEEKLHSEGDEKTSANRPLVRLAVGTNMKLELSPDVLGRRCSSKSRGTVYHPVFEICCHFCRQKTLCVEEDCKRCGDLDMDQPCLGKTDCSVCHSSNGVLCRACLKVRYGEEMEVVRRNKQWMCPHCIEDKGIKPYWICNSSLCLRKRKKVPTGVAIFKAREMGYKSVAHLLMDELQRTL
ncbi:unnamed protein product [Camellia sinensis]